MKIYEDYEGMGDGDVLFVRGTRHLGRRHAAARGGRSTSGRPGPSGGYDIWDERQPEYNFRGALPRGADGRYEFQTMLPKPYTVPTRRARRPLPGGGRPASVATRAHPLQGDRARAPAAGHAGLLPRRPVPRERHHRRGQAGARAARCEPDAASHLGLRLRHRACAPAGVSRFASCSLGGRRFAALVEGDVVRPLRDIAELGARHAVGGARRPAADRRARAARRA